ncbi:hypothetical protein BU16DRAFT_558650 [Lophium mytilinum]|uniref:Uncharacterized protein n=1 Tax=Lophium mytilinum TaxID=390894 RepID=A0A6A6R2K2_9PEZI|nr:hypothetical protein BU16DRAFT_558650 [Lophium mytilinum]
MSSEQGPQIEGTSEQGERIEASTEQGQRIVAHSKIIWGDGEYHFDIGTIHDKGFYMAYVYKGDTIGQDGCPALPCDSPEQAWGELDRMLGVWARQVQTGLPMTREDRLDILGGAGGRNWLAEKILKILVK